MKINWKNVEDLHNIPRRLLCKGEEETLTDLEIEVINNYVESALNCLKKVDFYMKQALERFIKTKPTKPLKPLHYYRFKNIKTNVYYIGQFDRMMCEKGHYTHDEFDEPSSKGCKGTVGYYKSFFIIGEGESQDFLFSEIEICNEVDLTKP